MRKGPRLTIGDLLSPENPCWILKFPEESFKPFRTDNQWVEIAQHSVSAARNRHALLGAPERDFSRQKGPGIDWFLDPLTGNRWATGASDNYRHQVELGEAKFVWELGRMPWLIRRAFAAKVTGRQDVARSVLADILDFADANTPADAQGYSTIHWQSGIEGAVRVLTWTWCLALIASLVKPTDGELKRIGLYIALVADNLLAFESRYSSANNHLVAEGAGLEIAGSAWPWLPGAETWLVAGRRILDEQVPLQILQDGYTAEMAPAYLLQVLEWVIAVTRIRDEAGEQVPPEWRRRMDASASLLSTLCKPGEALPHLGDSDDGELFPLTGTPQEHVQDVVAALTGEPHLPLLILAGKRESEQRIHSETNPCIIFFKNSGLLVARSGNSRLVFDCSPHGLAPLYAHAHSDATTVCLDFDGKPVLVDSGTFCYHAPGPWRDWFRSTSAHNVLQIENLEQSDIAGPFMWSRTAKTTVRDKGERHCCASHDGFHPVVVSRTVAVPESDRIEITDEAEGPGRAAVRQFWHFAPGSLRLGEASIEWTSGNIRCCLQFEATTPLSLEIVEGSEDPIQGWFSPSFNRRIPAPVAVVKCAADFPLRIRTRIGVGRTDP